MGRPERALYLSILVLVLAACSSSAPRMHANDVLDRVDTDSVRFFQEYDGKVIIVTGHVGSKGLVARERSRIDMVDFGPVIRGEVESSTDVLVTLAFDPARRVMCYFEPSQLDSVAHVDVGQRISAECNVASVRQVDGRHVVQLGDCELVEQ